MGRIRDRLLTILGDVKVFRWPMFLVYDPGSYRVKGRDCRTVIETIRPGDVLVRGYDAYVDGKLIPGLFSHAALYVGPLREDDRALVAAGARDGLVPGAQMVVHSIAEGVLVEDILDFCRCDRMAILRFPAIMSADPAAPADDPAPLLPSERAIRDRLAGGGSVAFAEAWPVIRAQALAQLGLGYDFDLDFTDVRRLSCTELVHRATRCLAPFLGVRPELHRILFLEGVGITPDAFVSSPLELAWASPSVSRRRLEALRPRPRVQPAADAPSAAA
jgi:hypothetical protein